MSVLPRFRLIVPIALRDLRHGWQSTACLTVAVAVALVPLLLLYGLKLGVVSNLIDTLREDPRIRELRLVREQPLSQDWFDQMAERPDVGFLLPRARYLAASVRLRSTGARRPLDSRMVPTAENDPFLVGLPVPSGFGTVILTERAAIELEAESGSTVTFEVLRQAEEQREIQRIPVTVIGIIPRRLLQTDDVFISPELESAVERWREGYSVPELDWVGQRGDDVTDAEGRTFASFRLFASDVRSVPQLRDTLLANGLDVETRSIEIEQTLAIEAGLGWVFLTVSVLSACGFFLTLGLHLVAAVVEKSRELSVLRLLGLSSLEMSLMPSLQGLLISASGASVACLFAWLAQPVLNTSLEGLAGLSGEVSRLGRGDLALATFAAGIAGAIAGSVAGLRAAALEPTRGLRSD
jgi:putative ABC transport system permease protein